MDGSWGAPGANRSCSRRRTTTWRSPWHQSTAHLTSWLGTAHMGWRSCNSPTLTLSQTSRDPSGASTTLRKDRRPSAHRHGHHTQWDCHANAAQLIVDAICTSTMKMKRCTRTLFPFFPFFPAFSNFFQISPFVPHLFRFF